MFSGEDSIRIKSDLDEEKIEEIVEGALDRLGRVRFGRRGDFTISARRFEGSFNTTDIRGRLEPGRKDGEWRLSVNYTLSPTPLLWILAIVLLIVTVFGAAIILIPLASKSEVDRAVKNAIRDARDDVEGASEKSGSSSDKDDA